MQTGRLASSYVDITDTEATLAACDGAAMLRLETPTNPLLDIARPCPRSRPARGCTAP